MIHQLRNLHLPFGSWYITCSPELILFIYEQHKILAKCNMLYAVRYLVRGIVSPGIDMPIRVSPPEFAVLIGRDSVQNTVYALNDMFLSLNFEPLREQRKNAHLKGTVR